MNPASEPSRIPQQTIAQNLQLMSHVLALLDQIVQARTRSKWAPKIARQLGSASMQERIAKLRALSDNPINQPSAVNELLASFDLAHDLLVALFPDLIQPREQARLSSIRRARARLWLRCTHRSGAYALARTLLPEVTGRRDAFMRSWLPQTHSTGHPEGHAESPATLAHEERHEAENPAAMTG